MAEQIFHLTESGNLEPMNEEAFELEDKLQELVAGYPALLSGEQMNPDNPRRFILIGREQGIADIVGGGNRWSLDHLLIDQDAVPTLVEAKRQGNSQIRREIVGQMMDYAAHATQTWNVGDIREAFESRSDDPDAELAVLLQKEPDVEKFWHDVETNLRAARLRLLFVADGIPDELTRVVEFLNRQMPDIEVLAVEIKQFKGEAGSTLVPRVIGRSPVVTRVDGAQSGSRARRRLTRDEFFAQMPNEQVEKAARRLLEVTEQGGGIVQMGDTGVSLRFKLPSRRNPLSLAWIYPVPNRVFWAPTRDFTFGLPIWRPNEESPGLVNIQKGWLSQFQADPFSMDLSDKGLEACAVSHEDAVANIDLLCERLNRVLEDLNQLALADL